MSEQAGGNRLKVGVVGTGALGRHHTRIYSNLDGAELVAVAECRQEAGQAVAAEYGTRWVADHRELLGCVDAVSVAVPTTFHFDVAADFLRAGIPVLVEKPLASRVDEAQALVDLAQRHGAALQVGHVERFNPAYQALRNACAAPPRYIRCDRWSNYAFRSTDIGVVHDLMIHDLDLVLDLVRAPVRSVEAFGVCILGGHEDSVQARLRFENGCIADFTANRVNPVARRALQVWTHEGTITADLTTREVVSYSRSDLLRFGRSPLELAREPGANIEQLKGDVFGKFLNVETLAVPQTDALTAELSSFIDAVQTGRQPLVDGRQALDALTVAAQILDAVATHRWEGNAGGAVGPHPQFGAALRKAG